MVKIVYDELVELIGPVDTRIYFVQPPPTVIMMCGLQGSGKTTTCGKLAKFLVEQGPPPAARRRRLAASGRRRAAPRARRAGRRAGLHRHDARSPRTARSPQGAAVAVCRAAVAAGEEHRPRHRHPRHRRPAAHRRRADGRAEGGQRPAQAAPDLPRPRLDERPGRGQLRQGVQRAARDRRPDPHQVRLRHPRRRAAQRQDDHRQAGEVHRRRREARRAGRVPPRGHGPAHPGHGRHPRPRPARR